MSAYHCPAASTYDEGGGVADDSRIGYSHSSALLGPDRAAAWVRFRCASSIAMTNEGLTQPRGTRLAVDVL
eukprot:8390168-Heterocapsa_arctica.AAC.1